MADNKQTQKAGDNAQQIQAGTVIINNGINESQARDLYSEMSKKAMEEYTAESHLLIEKRIADFANVLIPRIEKIENGFESFSDPEFQLELRKAQVASACTDKEADYEMLSELLLHRIENKDSRRVKASISKAVEIVDKIDDDGLCGLTVAYSITEFNPISGSIKEGLNALNDLFGQLRIDQLPKDYTWVLYLDILDVIRSSQIATFKKLVDYVSEKLMGYTAVGINKESENYYKAIEILKNANMDEKIFIEHELNDGYVRLPIATINDISSLMINRTIVQIGVTLPFKINENEKSALKQVWDLYEKNSQLANQVKTRFTDLWMSYSNLSIVKDWWDAIPHSFTITPIGKVLAHANAQRYAKIPEIDLTK